MGLAPYGNPKYVKTIKDNLIDIKDDGSFQLNMEYFDYCTGLKMTNTKFDKLFDGPSRKPESEISQKEMDIAASIHKITEEVVIKLSKNIYKETKLDNLCLAGGVALNCVANGALIKEGIFKNIWIQPASGDAGGALGAALSVFYMMFGNSRLIKNTDSMNGSYLGPSYKNDEILSSLNNSKAIFEQHSQEKIIEITAKNISEGKAVGLSKYIVLVCPAPHIINPPH